MKEIEGKEIIEAFKILIEETESEKEKLNSAIHSGILVTLSSLKISIHSHFKNIEAGNYEVDSFNTQTEFIDKLNKDLREIMKTLKPSLLRDFGLISSFENHAKKMNEEKSLNINLKNDISDLKNLFPYEKELNIFRTFDLILNYLLLISEQEKITIFLNVIETQLYLEFVCGKSKKENANEIAHSSNTIFKKIQVRLILLNAKVGQNSDWLNFVQIIIPFET